MNFWGFPDFPTDQKIAGGRLLSQRLGCLGLWRCADDRDEEFLF